MILSPLLLRREGAGAPSAGGRDTIDLAPIGSWKHCPHPAPAAMASTRHDSAGLAQGKTTTHSAGRDSNTYDAAGRGAGVALKARKTAIGIEHSGRRQE